MFDLRIFFVVSLVGHPDMARRICLSACPIVCPSSRLAVRFLRIGSFVFSEIKYGGRGPYLVISDRAGFFLKK